MSGSIAVGSLVEIGYVAESVFGSTPVGEAFQKVRDASFSVNLQKETYQSEERRSDRSRQDVRHGYNSVAGDIAGELSEETWDDFIQAVFGGTWASGASTSFTSVSINTANALVTCTSANFVTAGFRVGDVFSLSINPSNYLTAISVGVSTIEVEPGTISTTATASATIRTLGQKISLGNTYRSFTVERWLSDLTKYQAFKGCRINQMSLSVPASGMVTVTFGIMGQSGTAFSGTSLASSYTDAVQTTPFAAVNGELYEGGAVLGFVTAAEITLNNNMASPQVVGANVVPDILYGRFADVTGSITVLFTSETMHAKFINETESTLLLRIQDQSTLDSTADFINIILPRIKYTGGDIDDSPDTGVTITMPFTALKPLTANTSQGTSPIVIQRGNG